MFSIVSLVFESHLSTYVYNIIIYLKKTLILY